MKGLGSEHDLRNPRTGSRSPSQICTVLAGVQWSTTQVRAASFPVRPVYCITIHQSSPNPTCNSCPARECSPQAAETVDRPHPGWLQTKDMEIRFILHASSFGVAAEGQRGPNWKSGTPSTLQDQVHRTAPQHHNTLNSKRNATTNIRIRCIALPTP